MGHGKDDNNGFYQHSHFGIIAYRSNSFLLFQNRFEWLILIIIDAIELDWKMDKETEREREMEPVKSYGFYYIRFE